MIPNGTIHMNPLQKMPDYVNTSQVQSVEENSHTTETGCLCCIWGFYVCECLLFLL